MKTKLNPVVLVGGVLCLVSMIFSYLSIRILGLVGFPIGWATCARYLNNVLYGVPIVGVLMLVSGLIDSRPIQLVVTVLGLVVIVWYLVTYRNPLNGEAIGYIVTANSLISNFVNTGINAGDFQTAATALAPFMHVGLGFLLFVGGTVLSGIGTLLNIGFSTGGGSGKKSSSSGAPKSYNQY